MEMTTFNALKMILVILVLLPLNALVSQNITTWIGGAPGMESHWDCHKNWSNYKVPDEFSNVVIPDVSSTSLATPVIKMGVVEVNSLLIQKGAMLSIGSEAILKVYQDVEGIDKDRLQSEGLLILPNEVTRGNPETPVAMKKNKE